MLTKQEFLKRFIFQGKIILAVGDLDQEKAWKNWTLAGPTEIDKFEFPQDDHCFFTPAVRTRLGVNEKKDVIGSKFIFADWDSKEKPLYALAPTLLVMSGNGYHYYFELPEFLSNIRELEKTNKELLYGLKGENKAEWNCNRFLRVPGTPNVKDSSNPVQAKLVEVNDVTYTTEELILALQIPEKIVKIIKSGSAKKYENDRSRRDMAVVTALVSIGATDELIYKIFRFNKIGDKFKEHNDPEHYLNLTIEKARNHVEEVKEEGPVKINGNVSKIKELDGIYWLAGKDEYYPVSTFTFEPEIMLEADDEDYIIGTITEAETGQKWEGVSFPRSAFNDKRKFNSYHKKIEWIWQGSDHGTLDLLQYLVKKLRDKGAKKVKGVTTAGFHTVNHTSYFVSDKKVLNHEGLKESMYAPVSYIDKGKEHPKIDLTFERNEEDCKRVLELMSKIQEDDVIWVLIGWYAATCLKQWLEGQGVRFPILAIYGTNGSGKTSLVKSFMSLFGNLDPNTYDSGTTNFMLTQILSSSNCFPVAFSESRSENKNIESFIYYMRLLYDQGYATRGKPDQTTVRYALTAATSIDGEDLNSDPAFKERIVVAHPKKRTTREGGSYWSAFKEFEQLVRSDLRQARDKGSLGFAGYYYKEILSMLEEDKLEDILQQADESIHSSFTESMNDRIRNNYKVVVFGLLLMKEVFGLELPDFRILENSISTVINLGTGRTLTQADLFIQDVLNALGYDGKIGAFKTSYLPDEGIIGFNIRGAFDWYKQKKKRVGESTLDEFSIRGQLIELEYGSDKKLTTRGLPLLTIDIQKARAYGLEIPEDYVQSFGD